ncbi:aminotransferase class V-fold PLP-dependent enzyme [Pseudidiomarina sediminum]|uniref:aminotransferase class V-fold PLP-dependent enzyme n=1 Tax=Pseudidiomarina sediminum TaxID=431675 RepID=UPI001C949960|nr:cysteine desulfurase [Pseudidiomarina sediminum]
MSDYLAPRAEFALFREQPELVYLDSAASYQVPDAVLQRFVSYYQQQHANAHRGSYPLAQRATALLEGARTEIAAWIGAGADEVVFTSGATQSFNMLAQGLQLDWQAGDEIVLSRAEHHANLLPWQRLAEQHQLKLRWLDLDPVRGTLTDAWTDVIGPRCKLVAVTLASNVTGQRLPVRAICQRAHAVGAVCVVDAAQAVASVAIDVAALECDALTFSAHKMYGVTGCGVLYLRQSLQARLAPTLLGGGMVTTVTSSTSEWQTNLHRFEAGTPNTAAIVTCQAAMQWLEQQRQAGLKDYLQQLAQELRQQLTKRPWLTLLPQSDDGLALVSFYSEAVHAFDLATFLAEAGIAVRAGSHCAQPLLRDWGHEAVVRVSFAAYNTRLDSVRLCEALDEAYHLFVNPD